MKFLDVIENIFFPRICMFCEKPQRFTATEDFCEECDKKLSFKRDRLCKKCGKPLEFPRGEPICKMCRDKKGKYGFVSNAARYVYSKNARKAVIAMKFHKNGQWVADGMGRLVAKTVKEEYGDIKFDCVVSVPLSKQRELKRGYNQTEIMAKAVAKEIGVPYKNALLKIKDNKPQSTLKASKREANVRGVYAVKDDGVADMTVLLIDDVFTTGATLNECSKMLTAAGALLVYTATACITVRGERFCASEEILKRLRNG